MGILLWTLLLGEATPYAKHFPSIHSMQDLEIGLLNGDVDLRTALPKSDLWSPLVSVINDCLNVDPSQRPTAGQALQRIKTAQEHYHGALVSGASALVGDAEMVL